MNEIRNGESFTGWAATVASELGYMIRDEAKAVLGRTVGRTALVPAQETPAPYYVELAETPIGQVAKVTQD